MTIFSDSLFIFALAKRLPICLIISYLLAFKPNIKALKGKTFTTFLSYSFSRTYFTLFQQCKEDWLLLFLLCIYGERFQFLVYIKNLSLRFWLDKSEKISVSFEKYLISYLLHGSESYLIRILKIRWFISRNKGGMREFSPCIFQFKLRRDRLLWNENICDYYVHLSNELFRFPFLMSNVINGNKILKQMKVFTSHVHHLH